MIPDNLSADRRRRRPAGATVEPGVRRVRPGPRVPRRPGPGASPAGQATGGADGAVRAQLVLRRRDVHRSRRRPTARRGSGAGSGPGMRIHGTTQCRPVEVFSRRGAAAAVAGADGALRRADLRDGEGASGSSHRSRQGALLGAGQPDRHPCRGPRRPHAGAHLPRVASWSRSIPASSRAAAPPTPPTCPSAHDRLRDARPRPAATDGRRPRRGDRRLRRGVVGHPAAVDEDAPGLRPAGPRQEVGCRAGRRRLPAGAGRRSGQRRADRPDARTRHRSRPRSSRRCRAR